MSDQKEKQFKSKQLLIKLLDQQIDINQSLKNQKNNLNENQKKLLILLRNKDQQLKKKIIDEDPAINIQNKIQTKFLNPEQNYISIIKYNELREYYQNLLKKKYQERTDQTNQQDYSDLKQELHQKQLDIKNLKRRVNDLQKKIQELKKKFKQKQDIYYQQKVFMQRTIQSFQHRQIQKSEIYRKKQMECQKLKQIAQGYNILEIQLQKVQKQLYLINEKYHNQQQQKYAYSIQINKLESDIKKQQYQFQNTQNKLMEWIRSIQDNIKRQQQQKFNLIKEKDKLEQEKDYLFSLHQPCQKKIMTLKYEIISKQKQFESYKVQASKKIRELDNLCKQKELKNIELKNMALSKKSKQFLSPPSFNQKQQCSNITQKIEKLGSEINELKSIQSQFPKKNRMKTFLKIAADNLEDRNLRNTQYEFPKTVKYSAKRSSQHIFSAHPHKQY